MKAVSHEGHQAGTSLLRGDLVLLPTVVATLLLCASPVFATAAVAGFPADCSHLRKTSPSGVYVIQPAGSPPRVVWCDMDTEGKGWTVVQRNSHDTELTWKQSWTTYKYGFGNVQGDHWLGTEYLHLLTQQGTYKVRFIVRNKANVTHYAEYDIFRVESEASGYPLRLGRFSGDGDDYLTSYHPKKGGIHDNMKFSTTDKDQDQYSGNCANSYGGWWYDRCQNVLLNAKKHILWPGFCDNVTAHPPSSWSNPQMCADRAAAPSLPGVWGSATIPTRNPLLPSPVLTHGVHAGMLSGVQNCGAAGLTEAFVGPSAVGGLNPVTPETPAGFLGSRDLFVQDAQ
nr:PREDICTED: LOW QUALITY PROTEIN: fibrinogen-like protein A [Haliaeetus albicilla]